jgi:hypothetical protein
MAKVKVLFLASNPCKQTRLALDEEIRAITSKIRSADYRDAIELVPAWAARPDDLQQLILQHRPRVVHFSGHGAWDRPIEPALPGNMLPERDMVLRDSGQVEQLVFMGERGQAHPISKAALLDLFSALRDDVHLVLINSCHSEPIAEAIGEVIPCSIGMSGAISDEAAITFAAAFYRGLGFGRNIREAFSLGKNALMHLEVPEDQAPRLYCRKGAVDPAKVVLIEISPAPSQHETRNNLGLSERPDLPAGPMDSEEEELPRYEIFVSYPRAHRALVAPLAKLLKLGHRSVFQEEITLAPGDDCEEVVVAALEASRVVILIWCSHARRSIQLRKEWALARTLSKRVVPVLLDKTPLPRELSKIQAIDLASAYKHSSTMGRIARFLLICCVIYALLFISGLFLMAPRMASPDAVVIGKLSEDDDVPRESIGSPISQLDIFFGFASLIALLLFVVIVVARGIWKARLRASQGLKLAEEIERRISNPPEEDHPSWVRGVAGAGI